VADRAVSDLLRHLRDGAPVDPHLADQLAILLALSTAPGESRYRTSEVTLHLQTHAELLAVLWPVSVTIEGRRGEAGEVRIRPLS
jgi:RNA 3'-terminal phosphate cyclase (ATP)